MPIQKTRRSRLDSDIDCTVNQDENSKIFIRETHSVRKWKETIEVKTPNLFVLPQIARHIEALPFAKLDVSRDAEKVVLLTHSPNRRLQIFSLDRSELLLDSEIKLPDDNFAAYCLLHVSDSSQLIFATRTDGYFDIFDVKGFFYYSIYLEPRQNNFDLLTAIAAFQSTAISSVFSDEQKFLDLVYVLQYDGTFSVFKLGKKDFFKLCSISLHIGLCGNFHVLPSCNLLIVSTHYQKVDATPYAGLNTFRLIEGAPYVEPIRVAEPATTWEILKTRLPFNFGTFAYMNSISVNECETLLCAISTSGDFFIFRLPSLSLMFTISYISGAIPRQVVFVDNEEICMLRSNGTIVRRPIKEIRDNFHAVDEEHAPRCLMVAPCARHLLTLENEGDSDIYETAVKERARFAVRLWMSTLWVSFKQLMGMAVGDSSMPLHKASHVDTLQFVINHYPIVTLQELFERTLDEKAYDKALSLAESHATIDADVIYKNQWRDACFKKNVTVEMVDILKSINDIDYRAAACWASGDVGSEVQRALLDLGLSMEDEAPVEACIKIRHLARIFDVIPNYSLFTELRDLSLLEIAAELAQRCELDTLECLLRQNFQIIGDYALSIVSLIPSCVPVDEYASLLPKHEGPSIQIALDHCQHSLAIERYASSDEEARLFADEVNFGSRPQYLHILKPSKDVLYSWFLQRITEIDDEVGLPSLAISLLELAEDRGYLNDNLAIELKKWSYYEKHIQICGIHGGSLVQFMKMHIEAVIRQYLHLSDQEILAVIDFIAELVRWKLQDSSIETIRSALKPLLLQTSVRNCDVLLHLCESSDSIMNDDLIFECLREYQGIGQDLLDVLLKLSIPASYIKTLKVLMNSSINLRFSSIQDALNDSKAAWSLMMKLANIRAARCQSTEDWLLLRIECMQLRADAFANLLDSQKILEILISEFLADDRMFTSEDYISLFLTTKLPEDKIAVAAYEKLGLERSVEILLSKSDEFLQIATEKNDPHLKRARFFIEVAAKVSKRVSSKIRHLDAVELALELGCSRLPVTLQYTSPYDILDEVVKIASNYKQGKKVAKLAVLLGIDTPVATALSVCALTALEHGDESTVQKYLTEIMSKARGIEKVHQLCMKLIASPRLYSLREDIYACALLNAPNEKLGATLENIQSDIDQLRDQEPYQPSKDLCSELVLDPMYSVCNFNEEEKQKHAFKILPRNSTLRDVARELAFHSSTHALALAVADPPSEDSVPWTNNDFLLAYEESINFSRPKLNRWLIEHLPPKYLIARKVAEDETSRALDRLTIYGCDKDRFVVDSEYRTETIIGLAMEDDDKIFNDASELAHDFKVDDFEVHFASLENALISLTPVEASRVIKARGHLKILHSSPKYQEKMRSSVLPLLTNNDAFRLYLSVFPDGSIERSAIPALKKIYEYSEKAALKLQFKRVFTDVSYLAQTLAQFSDKQLIDVAPLLRLLPRGRESIESLVRFLIEGTELRPPASALALWTLLDGDEEEFLDVVAIKSREDEIIFLRTVPCEQVPEKLAAVVQKRLTELTSGHTQLEAAKPETEDSWNSWSSWSMGSSSSAGLVNRRKN